MLASDHPPADPRTRDAIIDAFPSRWADMIAQWNAPDPEHPAAQPDSLWLLYTANYLVRARGVRFAIDPRILDHRIRRESRVDFARDLASLDFVILTHAHGDHLDLPLIEALRDRPIEWIIPQHMFDRIVEKTGLPESRVRVPEYLKPFDLRGITLTAFEGRHWQETPEHGRTGIDSTGYLFEWSGKRLLLPGDTRTYDRSLFPDFGPVDAVLAHLWLGRGGAERSDPPLLEDFCHFILDFQPRRIILTHLHELTRGPGDCWGTRHADLAVARFNQLAPDVPVIVPNLGDVVDL